MEMTDDIRLVVLDFDGTMADTRHIIVKTMRQTIEHMQLEPRTEQQLASMIGLPLKESFLRLHPISEQQAEECATAYRRIFETNNTAGAVTLFPHVENTLRTLHAAGKTLTIASSRNHSSLRGFVDSMHIDDIISYMLGADDTAIHKPEPEPVLRTLRDLGFCAGQTIVVGDTDYDICMGRNAGTLTCGVTYGNGTRESLHQAGADYIIDDFAQLAHIILK